MADDGKPIDLYEADFLAWTERQAAALRACTGGGVDWERVADEIEDMGKRDQREVFSRVEVILEHLLKLEAGGREAPKAGWRETIVRERLAIEAVMTPTLRRRLEDDLDARHRRAAIMAAASFAAHEPERSVDVARRWTLAEILGE